MCEVKKKIPQYANVLLHLQQPDFALNSTLRNKCHQTVPLPSQPPELCQEGRLTALI